MITKNVFKLLFDLLETVEQKIKFGQFKVRAINGSPLLNFIQISTHTRFSVVQITAICFWYENESGVAIRKRAFEMCQLTNKLSNHSFTWY